MKSNERDKPILEYIYRERNGNMLVRVIAWKVRGYEIVTEKGDR